MYDLVVDGTIDFFTRIPGLARAYRRQPLAGIVDGVNKVFLLPLAPVSATIVVYFGTIVTTAYVLDAVNGVVTFTNAPTVQPTADFTALQLNSAQVTAFVWGGFMMMEWMNTRGYSLSSSNTAYAMAVPTDAHIYICQGPITSGAPPADPICGVLNFSTSYKSRNWLAIASQCAYLEAMALESAMSDINYTERVGGVRINTDHRSSSIRKTRDMMDHLLRDAMYAALDECYPDGHHYGGKATFPHTEAYETLWNWRKTGSILYPTTIAMT